MITILTIKSIYFIIIQLIKYLPKVYSVKGCVTFVYGNDYSMRQSICDKLTTHFQTIPLSLPNEVIKLTINHQDLYELNASQLIHLPNLIFLNLDSNKIKIIHSNTFNHLNKLQTLSLRYNQLTISIESFHPNVLYGLNVIEHLNLLHNPIGNIPNHYFLPISKTIRSISLSDSTINLQLNMYSLHGLYKLQLLDLSNNNLENLPNTYELAFNQMQLKELYLYGNPWKCDCHLRWLKQWFIKYHTKLIYTKSINEIILHNNIDIEANNWLINEQKLNYHNEMNTLLQPKCATPIELHGRPLFNYINNSNNNNNNTGIQSIRSVDFHCTPESHTPNQQIQLIWGSNSTLSCKFFADPSGIVIWYKDGIRIQNHWPRIITKQSQGRNFLAELIIENIQHSDAGIYVCYLDTGYGHVNTTFNVHVNGDINTDELSYHNGVFYWISKLDTTLVLKYTGMIAACLIILLGTYGFIDLYIQWKRVLSTKTMC
ncbi:Immunoglobulin superfamily member 10 [Schistosoma japonicum]|uniref:Immunoglobulin superfamily member 10 n=1 Tax=Schistosoma japonicum TaxID=6182 RepID=A0A4Z2DXX6_SCHJA|nr:Immunoglobulin superfamily member 10 [Schistosoma japonicum]